MRCIKNWSILTLYLPRCKWTLNETLIFFKIVPLAFNIIIPVSFSLVRNCCQVVLLYYLNAFNFLKSLWGEFSVEETRKVCTKIYLGSIEALDGYHHRKWTWQAESKLFVFHIVWMVCIQLFSLHLWVNSRADWAL